MERTASHLEHVDVLIVGAGISGIGAAYYLQKRTPGPVLRHPGGPRRDRRHLGPVPLPGHPLGLRPAHLRLRVQAVARRGRDRLGRQDPGLPAARRPRENGIDANIRFHHKVLGAAWSSRRRALDRRRASVPTPASGCSSPPNWLFCAGGYYRYDEGYTPDFAGRDRFGGQIVHPQHWPEDLDYTGKRSSSSAAARPR